MKPAALALGAVLGLTAGGVWATPVVDARTETYPVTGATEFEVRDSLDRSPLSPDGKRRIGYTQADIHWQFLFREAGDKCRVTSVTVTLTVVTTLPRWTTPFGAPRTLIDLWDRFLGALTAHEQGHSDIALAAARRMEDALWRAPSPQTCRGYDDALGRIANEIFDAAVLEQEAFDAATAHGATQGVHFP